MFETDARVLVAVSGGKDSLALWDMLVDLGYRADGLYIGLGIGEYSEESHRITSVFAEERGLTLHTVDLRQEHGFDIPTAARATRRVPCSACGLSKRHIFDRETIRLGYDVLATGHNLDDEAAVLLGNTIRWDVEYLTRQYPVLEAGHGFPRKVKPLVRLTEREMAAWCVVRGIDYVVEECPMAIGNRHSGYKETLNQLDERSPGTKASFYLGFLDRMVPVLRTGPDRQGAPESCPTCGAPSSSSDTACSFCRLEATASSHEPVPVRMVLNRSARRAFDAQWGEEEA
ncbi:MAG: adenine nucleotide alpha hydrolase family protein [Actinobacteria bacterium]|nr:adenine nucleotide alpha hydrolase family protein [Actinomycetota bacterium]